APAGVPFDHTWAPAEDSFTRKPPPVSGPPPKLIVPENAPVTMTLPTGSIATPLPALLAPPPNALDHRCTPAGEYFATKTPKPPRPAVSPPPPKSTVPRNCPVTTTFPAGSAAIP